MSWIDLTEIATLATLVIAIAALGAIVFNWWEAKHDRRQDRYLRYEERYADITAHLPYNIFAKNGPATSTGIEKAWLVNYINLCNDEHRDHLKKNRIKKANWDSWVIFMLKAFDRSIPLKGVFDEVKDDYPRLRNFLESEEAKTRKPPKDAQH